MKLYGSMLSPFVSRVVFVAQAKGVDIVPEYPPITGDDKLAYLAFNPSGKIPFLDDDGFYLGESAVIADYLDGILPGPSLWPSDVRARARAALLARYVDVQVSRGLVGYLRGIRDREEGSGLAQDRKMFVDGIAYIEHYRDAADTWLFGDRFGHADAALLPFFYLVDRFTEANLAVVIADHAGLARYWDRAKADPFSAPVLARMAAAADAALGKGANLVGAMKVLGGTPETAMQREALA